MKVGSVSAEIVLQQHNVDTHEHHYLGHRDPKETGHEALGMYLIGLAGSPQPLSSLYQIEHANLSCRD